MGFLRFFLAIAVVVAHSSSVLGMNFVGGQIAVQLFFAISGFYMALIWDGKYTKAGNFYFNRFLRLYPVYLVMLLATMAWLIFIWWYTKNLPPPYWLYDAWSEMPIWQALLLAFSNLTMVGLDIPSLLHYKEGVGFIFMHYADGSTAPDGAEWAGYFPYVRQAWSIGAEIWFYMLVPWLVRGGLKWILPLMALSFLLNYLLTINGYQAYYFFPAQLAFFLVGMLAYHAHVKFPVLRLSKLVAYPLLVLVLFLIAFWDIISNEIGRYWVYVVVFGSLPTLFHATRSNVMDKWIGELSYPIYMSHLLVISVMKTVFKTENANYILMVVILFSWLLVKWVDQPVDRIRQRMIRA